MKKFLKTPVIDTYGDALEPTVDDGQQASQSHAQLCVYKYNTKSPSLPRQFLSFSPNLVFNLPFVFAKSFLRPHPPRLEFGGHDYRFHYDLLG